MIVFKEGNILTSNADVIFHQVNCQGVMGAGLAKQIREWCPKHYEDYIEYCKSKTPDDLLGWWVSTRYDSFNCISGLFGQLNYGRNGRYTDYAALERGLAEHKRIVNDLYWQYPNCRFAVPYKIGCGLAGGDWNIVYGILVTLFGETSKDICNITLEIWKYEQ